ncbi:HTH_48 domain-containing protein [Caerostris darwini]|uniref:HTH_48 domain-containing protein n=1 Tax=Caerostris darwini TaxID=1538125 RepID=A0AAV4Q483_9ARAC|nr:HTH_48 domain-containing protein [Caerostris darwini]
MRKRNEPDSATSKAGLHLKKAMLCVWWDGKRILLLSALTKLRDDQFRKVFLSIRRTKDSSRTKTSRNSEWKGVVFHQNNARPRVSLTTRWNPFYSPVLAPSNFQLFLSLQNFPQ